MQPGQRPTGEAPDDPALIRSGARLADHLANIPRPPATEVINPGTSARDLIGHNDQVMTRPQDPDSKPQP